jgi:xanthine dehydrogenase accessory factor
MIWIEHARHAIAAGEPALLVTVLAVQGSAPREPGARMLVLGDRTVGSIGGGHLEFAATATARRLLDGPPGCVHSETFALGPALDQCCGGKVRLLFEPLAGTDLGWLNSWEAAAESGGVLIRRPAVVGLPPMLLRPDEIASAALPAEVRRQARDLLERPDGIALVERKAAGELYLLERAPPAPDRVHLFGAGHVGAALVQALAPLPFRIDWIDGRAERFPAALPANVRVLSATPAEAVAAAPADAFFLVMTHSHPLDFEICERVLRRGDFAYLGLIGSETKRARFVSRLRARGVAADLTQRLTCPIGIPEIGGKHPAVIAVAVAAQLVALSEQVRARIRLPQGRAG